MIDFTIDWKDAPGVRDPVLARTWCGLTIRIGSEHVTRVFDRRTKGWRNCVYGSVFPLCRWMVDNLWFLLYEPYRWSTPFGSRDLARNDADRPWVRRHSLLAAREGGALPDLTLFRDGDSVLARWLADGGDASHPSLRFVQKGRARLSPNVVGESVAGLVESVLQRVAGLPHADVSRLRDDWRDLCSLTPEEARLCGWAARLGIDAHYEDELSDGAVERLTAALEGLETTLADDLLDVASLDTISNDLEWIDKACHRARAVRLDTSERSALARPEDRVEGLAGAILARRGPLGAHPHEPLKEGGTAYAVGYERARSVRAGAGIGTNSLPDMVEFLRCLGWADAPLVTTDTKPSTGLLAVLDQGREDVPVLAAHPPADEVSGRFLLARSVFLQAATASAERRLVTSAHTWDQRASRAFAAELLAPAEALRERIRRHSVSLREVAQYADEFMVAPSVIERQLENHAVARVDRGSQTLRQW